MIKAVGITNGKTISLYNKNALFSLFFVLNPIGLIILAIGILFLYDEKESKLTGILLIIIGLFLSVIIFFVPIIMRRVEQNMIDKIKMKQEHILIFEDNVLFVDNIENELNKKSIIYKYKNFILIVLNKANYNFYIIYNNSFIDGNRKLLLNQLSKIITIKNGR